MDKKALDFHGTGLAPMAGAADSAFRAVCMRHGADWCVSEMISAKALVLGDKRTPLLARHTQDERPFGIQLFGSEPETLAKAASMVEERFSPAFIDINMGCPAPKITSSCAGAALLKNHLLAESIADAVVKAVSCPVTAKLRAGYEKTDSAELAKRLEGIGIYALAVHGRTALRQYRPPVDLEIIKEIKAAVSIPVIGNGDISCADDARSMLDYTSCDGLLVGRAALGNPFIFAQLKGDAPPSLSEKLEVLREQTANACAEKGEYIGMLEARKHAAWYLKGFPGAAKLRERAMSLATPGDLDEFIALAVEA